MISKKDIISKLDLSHLSQLLNTKGKTGSGFPFYILDGYVTDTSCINEIVQLHPICNCMQPCVIWFLRRPKFRNPRSVVINTFHFRFKRVVSSKLVMEQFHWNVSMTRCSMHIIAYILHSALNICPQQLKTYNEWNRSTYIPYTKCLIKINLRTITRVAVSCKPLFIKELKKICEELAVHIKSQESIRNKIVITVRINVSSFL